MITENVLRRGRLLNERNICKSLFIDSRMLSAEFLSRNVCNIDSLRGDYR